MPDIVITEEKFHEIMEAICTAMAFHLETLRGSRVRDPSVSIDDIRKAHKKSDEAYDTVLEALSELHQHQNKI